MLAVALLKQLELRVTKIPIAACCVHDVHDNQAMNQMLQNVPKFLNSISMLPRSKLIAQHMMASTVAAQVLLRSSYPPSE